MEIIALKWIAGLLVSLVLGDFVTKEILCCLRNRKGLPIWYSYARGLGYLERIIYTLSLVNGYAYFIGVWLGIKAIGRWKEKDAGVIPDEWVKKSKPEEKEDKKKELAAALINVYLIGNLVSLLFAVAGAFIIGIKK